MIRLSVFALASVLLLWLSREPLRRPGSHGFYRFFAAECILALFVRSSGTSGGHWLATHQLLSHGLMVTSVVLLVLGLYQLRRHGEANRQRDDAALLAFERTTTLVRTGIYRYIRHPMYASLLALAWGSYCHDLDDGSLLLALLASGFLVATARADERECAQYFGDDYQAYRRNTKMFIPGLI
jgi:protein-S-isoprenylcysteine O-methyltransferase Ste14